MPSSSPDNSPLAALLALMVRLRAPQDGCPWDREQTFATIAPYTIEEAYEVADAIARHDLGDLREELGDLLFQVVFHARIAEEQGAFTFADVAEAITGKMIARHPHIFGDADAHDAARWEDMKAQERAAKAKGGLLDDVPLALPALLRAAKLQKRAARIGFDWPDLLPVLDKLEEEIRELKVEIAAGSGIDRLEDELGDMLFVMANIGRHLGVEAETALRAANAKFERRFRHIERRLAEDGRQGPQQLDFLDSLWNEAKALERQGG
ncbi:nucleoside triphosphate pyrophosphohydrolase [Zavarzinia compransoris]|uniref:Nucleoside triphosphate pyrophosphohydrolase n=1 Tax=Zavarzinia compransoris TaxID=1264899 RepID=A0A317EEJ2_9PROT|nr:nucleoside triphosphate pyrophosphohydrolase [Zavarzinia compransoris]PWR23783.1 nucleoside triphosphate pyrophosphohydrolase [Zavarzinia compransoris]TDP48014.1 tetrapyrrole methylase family protein/MazG family protein/ATP diphosphatase [Zavarzinia compransoris]